MAGKFNLGKVVATNSVHAKMQKDTEFLGFVLVSLKRYCDCNWGKTDKLNSEANDIAVESGVGRIFASYKRHGEKIWIITEPDRSYTTVLFPGEY